MLGILALLFSHAIKFHGPPERSSILYSNFGGDIRQDISYALNDEVTRKFVQVG